MITPTLYEATELCVVYKSEEEKDTRALDSLFTYLGMKLYLKNFSQVIIPVSLFFMHGKFLLSKMPKAEYCFTAESVDEYLTVLGV